MSAPTAAFADRPTVAIATLGCRLNQVDSQALAAGLERRGFRTVPFDTRADVVVVNTCTVTARADVSDRQMIRRAARRHPGARIVVTGCWAQTDSATVAALRGVDLVVGNADKPRLPGLVERLLAEGARGAARVEVGDVDGVHHMTPAPIGRALRRSRAFLKVQDGCQHRCAFCIVPLARGGSRSLDPRIVVDEARQLVEAGHREIVLTGIDLGHYGADLVPRRSLAALVRELIDLPGLRWVRLSSVLPAYFTPELVDIATGSDRLAPHFHVPLQSGSDRVLRRMCRPYNVAMYRRLVERLAAAVPRVGLGADVIVGFPGETEDDFAATVRLVEALPFSYLHVFGYSDRNGTAAMTLADHVDSRAIAGRSRELRALADAKSLAFRRAMVGEVEDALVLETRDRASGRLTTLTGNYVEVIVDGGDELMRTVTRVRMTSADATGTRGAVEVLADR